MVYWIMVDKRVRHHELERIKAAFSEGRGLFTGAATRDAIALGYDRDGMTNVIRTIEACHFYKSMTSIYDSAVWQDVYHVPEGGRTLYVKFTDNGTLVQFTLLSFKEK
jgi:motility quorum-sensing regulator/GCU-specific mRNA interferase toxin